MKILITGGTGGIGKRLTQRLIKEGFLVRLFLRKRESVKKLLDSLIGLSQKNKSVETVIGDLLDLESLYQVVEGVTHIIHLAAVTHTNKFKLYWQINYQGTVNLIKAYQKLSTEQNTLQRFVFISSRAAVKGGGAYAESKLAAESFVRQTNLPWTILRLAEVYGTKTRRDLVYRYWRLCQQSLFIPLIGDGAYTLAPLHIDDVVATISRLIQITDGLRKTYTLAGPDELTLKELVNFFNIKKRSVIKLPVTLMKTLALFSSFLKQPPVYRDQIARLSTKKESDISLAVKDLGFQPRNLQAGIKEWQIDKADKLA